MQTSRAVGMGPMGARRAAPALGRPRPVPLLPRKKGGRRGQGPSSSSPSSPPLLPPLRVAERSKQSSAVATVQDLPEPSPFFEPLVRSFVLGLGAGAIFEAGHVAVKFLGLASQVGLDDILAALPGHADQFSPLFLWDHVAALGSWFLLYLIEAIAVLSVLQSTDDPASAARAIRSMATLPKRMLPVPLSSVKRAVYRALLSRPPAPSAAAAAAAASPFGAAAGNNTNNNNNNEPPSSTTTMSFRSDVGTSVLERETAADVEASVAAPLPRAPPRRGPGHSPAPGGGGDKSDGDDDDEKDNDADDSAARQRALDDFESLLSGRRAAAGLKPGAWDPAVAAGVAAAGVVAEPPLRRRRRADADDDDSNNPGLLDQQRLVELEQRSAYLRNFWYAAALSQDVKPGTPHGVDMLGGRVVLFRDAATGAVRALDDACPHRGAPLSGGWLAAAKCGHGAGTAPLSQAGPEDATAVVCPYHGWAFDGDGRLRDVPSAEAGRWPKRPLVETYPVEERGGFVWLFFGDARLPAGERPPIPFAPELEAPGWRAVYGELEFDCPHWPVFENAIDMAHIHYLHDFGNQEAPRIENMSTTRESCFSVAAEFDIRNKPISKVWEWTAPPNNSVPVVARAMLPSTSSVQITLAHGVSMITFVSTVPIDERRAVNRFCLVRNFATQPVFDGQARRAMLRILGEDKAMIERVRPERVRREYSLGPDAPQVAFRKLRQEWVDLGYASARGIGASVAPAGGGGKKGGGCGGGGGKEKGGRDARLDL